MKKNIFRKNTINMKQRNRCSRIASKKAFPLYLNEESSSLLYLNVNEKQFF